MLKKLIYIFAILVLVVGWSLADIDEHIGISTVDETIGQTVASGAADPCATANGTTIFCVDPGVVGGTGDGSSAANAYASLSAAEAAEEGDIRAVAGGYTFLCMSSDGTDDTTAPIFAAWETDADSLINIVGMDFPSDGVWDDSAYIIKVAAGYSLRIQEEFVNVKNLQVEVDSTGGIGHGIYITTITATNAVTIEKCIVRATGGNSNCKGIETADTDLNLTVLNTIVYGFTYGTGAAMQIQTATANIFNCTVSGSDTGIHNVGGTTTVTNSAVFNNTDDYNGTFTATYSASDDTQAGTGNIDWANGATDWAANFTAYATGDFSVKDGDAGIDDAGTDLSGSGITDDITDKAREGTCDIGAFEF